MTTDNECKLTIWRYWKYESMYGGIMKVFKIDRLESGWWRGEEIETMKKRWQTSNLY